MMAARKQALSDLYPRHYEVPLLILGAGMLLGIGLSVPLFHVTQMVFWKSDYSVITGILQLFNEREYFLAGIIFVFSVVFPIIKLLTLLVLWVARLPDERRLTLLHWLGFLGKWSMLDVLILALTIVILRVKILTDVQPQRGVYLFCAAILLSMIATTYVEFLARKTARS